MTSLFARYIGVDYSGAADSQTALRGLRMYVATSDAAPTEWRNPSKRSGHWTREELAKCLQELLSDGIPTVVAIDHGFSFPRAYFDQHRLPDDWRVFLDDFCQHWPTAEPGVWVRDVRQGRAGQATARSGNSHWRRAVEQRHGAKSVFHFDAQGSVASSTHAGLPWLRWLLTHVPGLHVWPFDGVSFPSATSVICEGYPALLSRQGAYADIAATFNSRDAFDAYLLCRWMADADAAGQLSKAFVLPEGDDALEGGILGPR